jgi:adenine-specific DNA-methyltransferase
LQQINQNELPDNGEIINVVSTESEKKLHQKIRIQSFSIKDLCFTNVGVKPFQVGKGNPKQTRVIVNTKPFVIENNPKPNEENWLPLLRGSLMNRYANFWNNNSWIKYSEWLAEPRDANVFKAIEKIVIRQTGDSIIATIISGDIICRNNLHVLISNQLSHSLILGILNSKLTNFYYQQINPEKGEALAEVKKSHLEQLPIPKEFKENLDNQIINLVNQLLQLNEEIQTVNLESKKDQIKIKINYCEDKVNELIYKLYDLTEEEIKLIENN